MTFLVLAGVLGGFLYGLSEKTGENVNPDDLFIQSLRPFCNGIDDPERSSHYCFYFQTSALLLGTLSFVAIVATKKIFDDILLGVILFLLGFGFGSSLLFIVG